MTIEATTIEYTYTGDGSTTEFPFPAKFQDNGDILVGVDGVEIFTGFSVTGEGSSTGGTVTFAAAPATGALIMLIQKPPVTQLTSYVSGGKVLESTLESALDKLTRIAQYLDRVDNRTIRLGDFDTSELPELPDADDRANRYVTFDVNGDLSLQDGPTVSVSAATFFDTYSGLASTTISGAGTTVKSVVLTGRLANGDFGDWMLATYSATAPAHAGYVQSADGAYWIFRPRFVVPEMFATSGAAATAAFKMGVPMMVKSGTVYLDITPTASAEAATARARHKYLMQVAAWHATCYVSGEAKLKVRITETGLITTAAYDALGTGVPVIYRDRSCPKFFLEASTYAEHTISAVTFGTRGANTYAPTLDPAVIRGANGYEVTITVTSALPSYVVKGYCLGLRNPVGTDDMEAICGAIRVETINAGRTIITGTIIEPRTAPLVNPGTIYSTDGSGGSTNYTYQGMAPSRLIVPSACIGWDTDYTVSATNAITGVSAYSASTVTNISAASPAVFTTSAAHNLTTGDIITVIAGTVSGLTDTDGNSLVDGQSYYVTVLTATTFSAAHYETGLPFDSTLAAAPYASGGTIYRAMRLTVAGHGYANGDLFRVAGVVGQVELNGRQFRAATVTTNEIGVLDLYSAGVDNSAYTAYTSGGTTAKVVEAWTGSDHEGYINLVDGGQMELQNIGFCYQGYDGSTMDQDCIYIRDAGTRFVTCTGVVLCGAGDKIVRLYGNCEAFLNNLCAGGGFAREAISGQAHAVVELVRSNVCGGALYALNLGDGARGTVSGCVLSGGSNVARSGAGSYISFLSSKATGGVRTIYAAGGRFYLLTTTVINRGTIGLDGIDLGDIEGSPRFGYRLVDDLYTSVVALAPATQSALVADAVGSATASKGGARWRKNVASNQSLGVASGLKFAASATPIDMDTDTTASGGTSNKHAGFISQAGSAAAGATQTMTLNNSLVTSSSFIKATINSAGASGTPVLVRATPGSGTITIVVANIHASAALNGTLYVYFEVTS